MHGVVWSLALNVIAYIVCSLARAPASIERLQADLFVPPDLAPMAPSFLLRRSSVTVGELTATVARYLGEERARAAFDSFAATRHISLKPETPADFQLLRHAEHLIASAIGAASSRLVLSLLLRRSTVSTQAALKLLDDASAAIHYNREILQTALDHVRQGIAVFDKSMHCLACWNRQFGEVLGNCRTRWSASASALDEILRFNAEKRRVRGGRRRGHADRGAARRLRGGFASRSSNASSDRGSVIEVRANRMPGGGIVTTFTDITPSASRRPTRFLERANENLERRVHERTYELELPQRRAHARQGEVSRRGQHRSKTHASSPPRATTSLQPLNAAPPLRHQPGRASARDEGGDRSAATK